MVTSLDKRPQKEFKKVPLPPDLLRDIPLTDNARTVLEKRYLRRGPDGNPVETEQEMFWRVAYHVAAAEKVLGGDDQQVELWARKYYDLLTTLRFFPNSPTFTGAGTPLGQLAACFVLPIQDDMGRTGEGIFETLRNAALIQQTGGGNGFSFSRLRPRGANVKSSNGAATGPVGFLRVYDQAFGEIAQGGCLTPETLVFTDRGLLRLDEIVTHQESGWQPHELHVSTDEGMCASYQGYNNGISPVLRIQTEAGIELTGTPNHKVKVMTANGAIWRRFDELQSGDSLLVMLGQHQGQVQSLIAPKKQHGNQVTPHFPAVLDEEFAFFLGYLAGDGFVAAGENDHRIGVSVAHSSYLMDELPNLMNRLFGDDINIHTQQKVNDASVTFVIDNRALKDFLLLNELDKAPSTAVFVPRLIRQSPPEIVGAFLRGLFEADGSVCHGYPQLLSSSERLIREVATLLIGLGCPVRISQQPLGEDRYGSAPIWNLKIQSFQGLQVWQDIIGCDEKSRFKFCMEFEPDLTREVSYVLPEAEYWIEGVLDAITVPQIDKRGTGKKMRSQVPNLRRRLLRYTRGARNLTLSAYAQLSEAYTEFAEHVRPVENQWFVTVSSVEDAGEALTLDIEVEGNHTYLANGYASHNSRRGANMAVLRVDHPDIREFIKCKTTEGAIENFNISVGITDKFMEAVQHDRDFDLINPQNGNVWETARAREIFDLIVEHAHHNGEPGVLFVDAANRENPVPQLYELESTNPCVTGDTLIYTSEGLLRAVDVFDQERYVDVAVDGRFGHQQTFAPASRVFMTGIKPIFRLQTKEGYYLRATADHRIMTERGWVALQNLTPGEKIHILNRKGGFGKEGSLEEGRVLGWWSSLGQEKQELAPVLAGYAGERTHFARTYAVEVAHINEVPEAVFTGNETMQRGFLQALFTADGSFQDGDIRLTANDIVLLEGVQQLLLNFGIASQIAQDELIISKANMYVFADEIGFLMTYKQEALADYISRGTHGTYAENFTATVESITPDGVEEVFDLTEPLTSSFAANGAIVHNCGEQWLGPFENCCLGSVNLAQHVTEDGRADWAKLRESVELSTRFLDHVVTANAYVPAVPQLREAAERVRRIGLGIMGLGDMMYALGVRYGSPEGQEFASQVMEFVRYHSMKTSIELAVEHGPYTAIDGSRYDPKDLKWTIPQPVVPHVSDWSRPALDWAAIEEGIHKFGIRNGAQTTIAPTGTISTVSGCEGYGCEPVFALAYTRYVVNNAGNSDDRESLQYTSPLFEKALQRSGLSDDEIADIIEQVNLSGTCQNIMEVPDEIRRVFVVAGDISAEEHIRMQGAMQAWVDNAISKTANFPSSATPEDVADAYFLGWELGCKGLTVYVTGSREKVVLETKATQQQRDEPIAVEAPSQPSLFREEKKPRPRYLSGQTYRIETPAGRSYITINENGDGAGQPFEVFVQTAKSGSEVMAVSDAIGRLISYTLRMASPVSPRKRVKEIIRQLGEIGGDRHMGFGPKRVRSLPDGIAQVLQEYIDEVEADEAAAEPGEPAPVPAKQRALPIPEPEPPKSSQPLGDMCPSCGAATLINEEGCRKCYSCAYSEC